MARSDAAACARQATICAANFCHSLPLGTTLRDAPAAVRPSAGGRRRPSTAKNHRARQSVKRIAGRTPPAAAAANRRATNRRAADYVVTDFTDGCLTDLC